MPKRQKTPASFAYLVKTHRIEIDKSHAWVLQTQCSQKIFSINYSMQHMQRCDGVVLCLKFLLIKMEIFSTTNLYFNIASKSGL